MIRVSLIVGLLLISQLALADSVRIYCKPDGGALIESRPDGIYTAENVTNPLPNFLIDRSSIPAHDWFEQLRCQGNQLTADRTFKPERVQKQEQIQSLEAELDQKLDASGQDPVEIIRLQRQIEKLKNELNPNRR